MTLQLLGFPTHLGLPGSDVRHGTRALRAHGLVDHLAASGLPYRDLGDVPVSTDPALGLPGLHRVATAAAGQRERVAEAYRPGDLLLSVGGDHSTALGSIAALRELGQQFDVLWLDAHGDFNSPGTSPSGNPHGMVLAMLCGYCPGSEGWLDGRRVSVLGARDLDPGEQRLLQLAGVRTLDPDASLAQLDRVLALLAPKVFISFDLDSLDPVEAPGVSTPAPGGFTLSAALRIVEAVGRRRQVVGMDLVEYNPSHDAGGRTAAVALAVVDTVLNAQYRKQLTGAASASGCGH